MADYARIQDRIYYGYGKAASKLGKSYEIYRAPSAINPIVPANLEGETFLSPNVSWDYMKANKYGNSIWQLVIDGRLTQVADYLVGEDYTFFVSAQQPLLPINGVECNRNVRIVRPNLAREPGENPYGGYEQNDVLELALSLPVSVLEGGRMQSNDFKLPLDTRSPSFRVLLPNLPGLVLRIGDFIDDEYGVRLAITSAESTDLGWRCLAVSEQV